MTMQIHYDDRTKELTRAHDAVDRLRDVAQRLQDARAREETRRDIAIRAALLIFIGLTVLFGFRML